MKPPSRRAPRVDDGWLDAEQQRAWRHVVALMTTLPAAIDGDLQRTVGLTMFEYLVLASLSEVDGSTLTMTDLAHRANSSLSRLSHVVKRLDGDGLVRRRPSRQDGRVSEVALTDAGAEKVAEAAPHHVRRVRELVIEPLTPKQLATLGDVAAAIVERVASG